MYPNVPRRPTYNKQENDDDVVDDDDDDHHDDDNDNVIYLLNLRWKELHIQPKFTSLHLT